MNYAASRGIFQDTHAAPKGIIAMTPAAEFYTDRPVLLLQFAPRHIAVGALTGDEHAASHVILPTQMWFPNSRFSSHWPQFQHLLHQEFREVDLGLKSRILFERRPKQAEKTGNEAALR